MKYLFKNGYVLDGSEDMTPQKGLAVIVNGQKIEAVVPENEAKADGCKVIDLKGAYLMPGLINMHAHLPASGTPKKKQTDPVKLVKTMTSNKLFRWILYKLCAGQSALELMSGVTTLRTVGGVLDTDSKIRNAVNAGKEKGPRLLVANAAITVPGGHMEGSVSIPVKTPEEAAKLVDEIADQKADLIKLMITGGVLDATVKGEPGILRMPPEIIKAAADQAHKRGLIVSAHVESPEGVKAALANGVDSIEHGAKPDDEMINLFKETGSFHIATISPALPFALFDKSVSGATEMSQYNGNVVFEGIIDCAKACLENGIPVGLGTDSGCPFITHYDMWREVNYFHKYCGVSKAFALHTATMKNAELAGLGDVTGSIEAGKDADIIVTEKNPLDDLTVLRDVKMVMARGKLYDEPKVKKSEICEKELDKFL